MIHNLWLRTKAFAAWLVLGLAIAVSAATPVVVNDTVEVQWAGQWRTAKVTKINPKSGWVTVALRMNSQDLNPTLPPDKVRAKGAGGGATKPAETTPDAKKEHQYESPEYRDWTEAGGKVLPRARVHNAPPGAKKILLQKPDGVCYSVELSQLSAKDRDYVEKLVDRIKRGK